MLALTHDCRMLDEARQRAVGAATLLLASDLVWKGEIAKIVTEEIVPAYRHGKLAFFLDFDRIPVGFVTWAHLSPETEERLLATLDPWLHLSEWNEGPSLWIRWLHLPRGLWREGLRLCLTELFPGDESARLLLPRKGRTVAMEIDRSLVARMGRLSG